MSKKLVLVESPAKAKTINKYLGKSFIVEATIGHIKNLPKTRLGVKIEDGFEPEYVTIRGKGDTIKKIKGLAAKSSSVYIATDPDREGEAIAQDVAEVLNGKNDIKLYRVLFNEITKTGVEKAMKDPRSIDFNLVQSQRARRVMDRIIGYKISPFLWKAIIENSGSTTLSAGRVQSVALKLICDKEAEIEKFRSIEYWSIWAIFKTDKNETFKAKLFSIDGKDIRVPHKFEMTTDEKNEFDENSIELNNVEIAQKYFDDISAISNFTISKILKRHTKRTAPAPFITSTLQAEASKRLRMRPKQAMMLAQKLYEGVELGSEGLVGLITYMRTDSTRISEEILPIVRNYIKEKYGSEYIPENPILYDKKEKANVQDAHEAIRPTSLQYSPEFVKNYLDDKSFKLYELIWKRFIASQMNPAQFETTVVEISADKFIFKAFGSALLFNGFQQVYEDVPEPKINAEEKDEYRNEMIPVGLEQDQKLGLEELQKTQHFTKPPARFTESTLIKALENKGIGRPSTYSLIVSTIQDRKYVTLTDRKLIPTKLGLKVNEVLVKNFPEIINEDFTAIMENELDQIAQGENEYAVVLSDFYNPFLKALKQVENKIEKIICEKCGGELVIKIGRFGKYLACNNYPKCENIKSFREVYAQHKEVEYTGNNCEKCGSKTVYREGKFGRFIGCERYPDCDFVKNITLGISCPKCTQGEVVERKSKRNKLFYGCSRYPDCDYVSWYKPAIQDCPNCSSKIMEERYSKKKGNYLKCPECSEEMLAELKEEDEN
ncbi:MAG: type I DNA topoisomerase [Ignavibacteriaceae bacterium]|nr:type I DNA topoisomerase [Ignavibacteriaceae bacterium]